MIEALLLLTNLGILLGQFRHGRAIKALQQAVIDLITGRLREVGPVEAQSVALRKQTQERITERRLRPTQITL